MKSFRRLVWRRTQAPKRTARRRQSTEVTPVMNALREDIPSEVIDLSRDPIPAAPFGYGKGPSIRRG